MLDDFCPSELVVRVLVIVEPNDKGSPNQILSVSRGRRDVDSDIYATTNNNDNLDQCYCGLVPVYVEFFG